MLTLTVKLDDPDVEKLLAITQREFTNLNMLELGDLFERAHHVIYRAWGNDSSFMKSAAADGDGLSLRFPPGVTDREGADSGSAPEGARR